MRKNQKANQQRRKELNKYKEPVHRTKKKIDLKLSITLDTLTARILKLSSDS